MSDTASEQPVDDHAQIRAAVRALCADFPGEYWRKLDRERAYPSEFVAALTKAGFLSALIPERYGGSGLTLLEAAVIMEEIHASGGNGGACHAQMYTMGTLLRHGSDAQKDRWLPGIAAGALRLQAFGVTEPTSGSDTLALRTTAVREGDHYRINGYKRFIAHAKGADFLQLVAATDPKKGSRGGLTVFLVDMDTPGVSIAGKTVHMMGDVTYEIALDDARVPAENRIGNEGDGMKAAQKWINANRVNQAARGLGVAQRCLEMITSYTAQRSTFGRPLQSRQAVQFSVADLYTKLQAGQLLTYRTASKFDDGTLQRHETFMTKIYCTELGFEAADRCMQFHGGLGTATEMPIERMWRQSRSFMITGGPVEIMRASLAREVFALYQ